MVTDRKVIVTGIGELLWDLLPGGKQLGGACANFTYHAQTLGAEAWLISSVGNDAPGSEILDCLRVMGMPADGIERNATAATGTVSIELSADGKPEFAIREDVAWDHITANEFARATVARADAVCFGSLAQRHEVSRAAIRSLVASTRPEALRIFDVNLRQNFFSLEVLETSLRLANVLKISDEELPVLAKFFGLRGGREQQLAELAARFDLKVVALTLGAHGSLFYSSGVYSEAEGLSAQVVDTVGAGDSFTAMLAMGLLAGWDLDRINRSANQVAAYVVSQPGGTPKLPAHLWAAPGVSLNAAI